MAAIEAELGIALWPVSAPGAVVHAGPAYFKALEELHGRAVTIDCGDRAGDVLACLRTGLRSLLFRGPQDLFGRLAAIARDHDAWLASGLDLPHIEVGDDDDLATCCRARLRGAPPGTSAV